MLAIWIAMATVITCNFARVAVHKSQFVTQEDGKVLCRGKEDRFELFKDQFQGQKGFELDYGKFKRSAEKIDQVFTQWVKFNRQHKSDERKNYIAQFSPEAWTKLSRKQKDSHQLQCETTDGKKAQCKGCFVRYRALTELFNGYLGKDIKVRAFFQVNPVGNATVVHSQDDLKAAANQWYEHGNATFKAFYGVPLAKALVHIPEVQEAFTEHNSTTKHLKSVAAGVKHNIEKEWQGDNNDVIVHQGTRESDGKYEERRMALNFETRESARKRARERAEKEAAGKCKKRSRVVGALKWGTWDWEAIREEVASWPDGKEVSWSTYAREKGIHNKKGEPAKNGGQMIQDWLIEEGINVHRFNTAGRSHATTPRPRRRKKRIPGSGNITMPAPRSAAEMRESLAIMIKDGQIPIGEMIVPKSFEKMAFNQKSGTVEMKTFTVEGRKHPLEEIRRRTLQEQEKFMRIRTDEEYEAMDHKCVKERLKELGQYNEDDCITNMRNKLKRIERTRHIAIWEDSSQISNHGHMVYMATTIYDTAVHYTDAEYHETYGEKVNVQSHVEQPSIYILARCSSSDSDQLCYCAERRKCLHNMDKSIRITVNGHVYDYNDQLRFFKGDLPAREFESGQQRGGHYPCPCGAHAARFSDIEYTYLDNYEVLTCEPLHDISHHVQNLFDELPGHMPSDIQSEIKKVYDGTLGNKELKRGCDYRVALLTLGTALRGKASAPVMELITSLIEIQRICYLPAEKRCQREILRLHNQAFIHTLRLRQVISHPPKKLTSRCLYGIYFHTLTTHAPMLYRIVPLSSTHTESEERIFNAFRGITRTTGSSRHPGQVIGNMLVRAHCERILQSDKDAVQCQPSIVSKAARAQAQQKDGGDTTISDEMIRKYPKAWQAHCERLSDYLLCGKDGWWTLNEQGDIQFFDSPSHPDSIPSGPEMLHFRNDTLTTVDSQLNRAWEKCLRENVTVPLRKIYIYSEDRGRNLTTIRHTDFLDTAPSKSGEHTHVTDPTEEVDASTIDQTEEDDSANLSDPVEQVRESADPLTLTSLEDDGNLHSEQVQSPSLESSTPARLGKENIRHDNPVTNISSGTPQRKDKKGLTKPLQLFQPAQQSALTREEASLAQTASHEAKQSSWGRNLRMLLGDIQEVETFETLKKKMKEKQISQDTKRNYDKSIAILQAQLSKCHSSLKMDLKVWERDFMFHNNCACPTLADLDNAPAHIKEITRRLNLARALMKAFGMKDF